MAKEIDKELFETTPVPAAVQHFVVPAIASTLITIVYNLGDTFFVGMMSDPDQVAALTVGFPYYQFMNAFTTLWGVGVNGTMARALGEKRYDNASKVAAMGLWVGAAFMLAICILFACFEDLLLHLSGGSTATYGYASAYMFWTFTCGGVPVLVSLVLCNQLRAEGHAKQASFGLMLGGTLDFFLNPLFIFGFDMGVVGAGMTTMISNCVSIVYFLLYYRRIHETSYIALAPRACLPFDAPLLGRLFLTGLPSCCLTLLGATGNLVQNTLYASYSDTAVAAWGIVNKISFIGVYLTHGVAQGVMPLIGYNFGAKNYPRVRAVNRCAIGILLAIAIALLAVSELFSPQIIRFFINDAATIEDGTIIMRCYMLSAPFMSMILLTSTLCQAVGKWQYSLGMLAIRQLLFNIPITFALNAAIGFMGVPLGQPSCDFISFFLALLTYRTVFVRQLQAGEAEIGS